MSGSAAIVITDTTGTVLKILTLGVDSSGDAFLTEKSYGSTVAGFVLDGCDGEDSKS